MPNRTISTVAGAMCLLVGSASIATAANIIHEFYVPMPDAQIRTALVAIEPAAGIVGTTMESVVSIVVTGTGSVIHYDEWEDGYEVDLNNPTQSTTKIWGDGNNANGIPPGFANDPASLASGAVINLRNQITLPRNPATVLYDGRDRFGGTKALVVTRTGWAVAPGTVLAGSVEVTATMDYDTSYIAPVGQDVSAASMFEYVGMMVMARENGTAVTVDINGPVSGGATTFTLNQGESYLVNGGVLKGATVVATKPVQTQLITGDIGARYETDWFTLYPTDQWTGTYFSPVGTAADGDAASGFFYNPNASSITINTLTCLGSGSFNVPAYGVYQYQMPQNCGARFTSAGGEPYFGIVMVGANPSANNVHDWGFTLVPSDSLTTEAVVGWGPGSSDLTQNGSPVWVTPIDAVRVYVDYNGDRLGPLTDPKGNKYDVHYDMSALETRRLFDPDKDQSAMRVYTLDGVQIAAAWGQDPATAGPGNPYLDVGTTVLPFPVPTLIKSVYMITDTAPIGYSIGDTIEYRIEVDNKGLLPLGNLLVLDPLNPSITYVTNTTQRDGNPIADSGSGTPFPLDESGYVVPIILRGGTTAFTYRCTINATGSINNTASNSNYNLVSTTEVVVPPPAGSTPCGAQFTNAAGVLQTSYPAGASIFATLTDPDANNNTGVVETITVVVSNTSNSDAEFVTLTETGANTGVFRNTGGLPTSTTIGTNQMDGTLLVSAGNSLSFTYTDPEFNETCSGAASISTPTQTKVLYLSTDGTGSPDQDMDRIDPVAASDPTTATSQTLQASSGGGTVTLSASKDTWLNSASTALNYGASTSFNIDRQGGGLGEERSLLHFDLSSIPAGATITSAQLSLTKTGGSSVSQNVGLYRVTSLWDEGAQNGAAGTASWSQRQSATNWTTAGGDFNATAEDTVAVAGNAAYTWNLASLVQGWMNGTFSNNGILMGSPDTGGDNSQIFASREHGTPANRPQLTVTYTTVAFDAASSNTKLDPIGTVTVNHTTGSGSNRLMLVGISFEDDNTAGLSITGVTYNGQALTFVDRQLSSQEVGCEVWRLVNPPSGPSTVQVTTTGSATGDAIFVGVATFSGVDQTTPLGTLAKATGTGATASVTATSAAGELVFDVLALDDARSASADSAQTARWNGIAGTADTDGVRAGGSTKAGAASVTTTWTVGSDAWALCAVPIKPVASSSTTTFTQAPNFASAFVMPAGGTANVTTYVNVTSGSLPGTPNVTAVLKYGSTTLATLTNPTYNSGAGTLIWSGTLGASATVPSGQPIDLVLTSNQSGAAFNVQYDSTTAPSKVSLPTTTVITNDLLGVYDAPYPGGSLITGPASGTTVYIRGTASDPFGAYDITSLGLSIDGPGAGGDITTTLNAGNVVNTTTASKTYEYAWTVGATVGTYNIVTTANEGTEGIQATRATSVNVTFLDLGTPSVTEFTTGANGPGTTTYAGNEQVCVRITDLDQNLDALVAETITATITSLVGDSELVTLTETGVNTGIFVFCIPASTTAPNTFNNGTLHAVLGDVLTVNYVDPTDPTDTGTDTATIPNIAPAVSVNKTLVTPADGQAVVGETLQYTVQVANTGNTTLNTISLVDTFPTADLTFVNANVAPSSTLPAGTLTWNNVGPLAPGQSVTRTLNFTALSTAAPAVNSATADAGGGVNSTDTANVTITDPKITITKTLLSPNPGPANIGDNVVFRIAVQNTGDTAIATLPIEDTYSGADFDFVSATVAPDASGSGSLLWLDVTGAGNLAVGNTITIDVTLQAKGAAAPATNLARADYTVDVNGDPAPPVGSTATITLIAAKISGHVYDDANTNGAYNPPGDAPLENITVSLYTDPNGDGNPADGVLIDVTTTDVNGAYEFLNLPTGNYVVVESQPPGYSSHSDTVGANDNRIPLVINTLTTFANNDFFDFLTPPVSYASIAGKVWNDANASATVNGGEVGIENVPVDLVEDTNNNGVADPGEPVIASTLTAADGTYSFGGLSAGNYVVVEHDLFGWYSTADSTAPNNNMIPVVLTSGSNVTGRDFLDVLTGTTGGKVFHDVNGNGTFDGGDVALANIDVLITDSLGATQTVVTDGSGNWTATVPPGLTTIDVQQSDPQFTAVFTSGYTQTAGTDSSTVTTVSSVNTPAGDDGFRQVGTITGHLYVDTNGDGDQDVGEPNLANVDVVITHVDSGTQTVVTDGSGNWTANVPPGLTTVDINNADPQFAALVLAGFVQTQGTDSSTVTAVANASTSAGIDGFFNPGTISGVVSRDTNNDNVADATQTGVQIRLFTDPNNDGDPVDGVQYGLSQNTNGSGAYSFTGLPPASYVVVMTAPSGYAAILDGDTTTPGDDTANASVTDARIPAAVIGGETDSGNNFLIEQYGTISGTVLSDINDDNIGDDPIGGVTLTLVDSAGNPVDGDPITGGVQPITTTTDGNGDYGFSNVPPGTYGVKETQPITHLSVTDSDAGDPDEVRPITVTAGGTSSADFVEEEPATINGSVLADTDNDDIGDTGILGVTLTLLDINGDPIDGDPNTGGVQPITVTTDLNGNYSFTNLRPGSYQVSELQPATYYSLGDLDGGDLDIIGDVALIVLDAGETDNGNDFIEEQYGSISGTVWKDTDNNNSGDTAFTGVVLTLLDISGAVIDGDPLTGGVQPITATTNGSGVFTFSNVAPGDYRVGEAQPVGYQSVSDSDGGNLDQIAGITVSAGTLSDGYEFVEEQLGEIRGTVFKDVAMQNVTVALFSDPNGDGDPTDGVQLGGTVVTNASGEYAFTSVAPGDYVVVETQPSGYVSVTDGDTTTPGDDAVNASTTDNRIPVSIAAGELDDGNAFVEGCPTITVNPASLPNGTVGTAYSQALSATDGTAPYTFAVTTGTLPAGLSLVSGVIAGTPTSSASQTFTITATDSLGCEGTRSYTVAPACPTITVNPATLPDATVGSAYSQPLSATGGTAAYSFAVTVGTLPAGLTLSGNTISGTATTAGPSTFTITATDANGCTGTRSLTITAVCPTITINPASLPAAVVGTAYSQQLTATGGTAPFSYAVTLGTLPAGLTLTGDTIGGTPTSTTSQTFTVTVTDDNGCEGTRVFTLAPTCPTISLASVPAVLPSGTVGVAYTGTITASGGTAAYTYAVKVGSSLPPGLAIAANGAITGTPTTNGTTNTIIVATDANGCSGETTFVFNVGCNTLAVAPGSISNGVVGAAYTPVVFNATGGTGVITWSQTGVLPAGMTFNTGTATLGGTPTEAGTFSISIIATDANTCSGSVNLTFSTSCPTITVNPATLPNGVVGTAYSEQLSAANGTGPYTFAVTSGVLPAGLTLTGDTISGTPTSTTSQTFTITATDDNGCEGTRSFTVAPVCPTITVNPATLPNGIVGTAYNQTLSATDGTAPYTFAVTIGTLPAGLNLNAGVISGTPTSTTAASFTITATDTHGCTGTRSFTLTPVCPTITVNPASLPAAVVGTAYNQALSATDGTAPYTYAVTTGSLPTGITLVAGVIGGTPTDTASETFTITATDAHGCTGTRSFTLAPTCPTITINPASLPAAVVGTVYSQQLTATGGTAPFSYAVTLGTLPAGLTLTGDTIGGTPTSTTSQTFTVSVTDDNGCEGTRSFTLAPTCPTISLASVPAVLPSGTVGVAYTGTITASGGTAAYTYAVKVGSSLPPGLAIAANGAITGTPTTNGTTNTIIVATDANGCSGETTFVFNVGCNTLAVAPGSISNGVVGTAYTPMVFNATGGTGVITWSQTGTLPAGMTFTPATATLGGTPTEAGNWSITIIATDANLCAGSVNLTFSTSCPTITVAPASLPAAVVGSAYSQVLSGNGGTAPYAFAVTTGTLPAGLTLVGDTIGGTPTSTTSQTFTITATDDNGCAGTITYTLAPTCPTITVTPGTLPNGTVGSVYTQALAGNGGTAPYTFAVTSGALPAGLNLNAGVIGGTPTSTTAASFTITATDAHGCSGSLAFTVTPVCPTITVNPASLPDAALRTAYSQNVSATGGTAPYTFGVTTGTLPAGLSLTGGTISGTPTAAGATTFTITATDSLGCQGTRNFTINVLSGAIGGHLYVDTNGDGDQDVGEPNLTDVSVVIVESGGGTQTVSTDGNGDWTASVPPGSTSANVDESDPDFTALVNPGYIQTEGVDPTTGVLVPASGSADGGTDGYFNPGVITGSVLADTNNDNLGDDPIFGVTLTLLDASGNVIDGDLITGGVQPITTTTDGGGNYMFTGVAPGSYRVGETQPSGYVSVSDADGLNPDVIGDVALIIVTGGSISSGNHFVEEAAATVGNVVWVDENNSGTKNGGESGLDGVVIELLDGSGNPIDSDLVTGGIQPTTTTTAGGGLYSFGNLPAGNYTLRIATPPALHPISSWFTDTTDNSEDDDDNGSQSVAGGAITSPVFALAAGENEQTLDFGLVAAGVIGNSVWHDADGDGIKDVGENGIDGVQVALFDSLGAPIDDPNQAGVQDYIVTTSGGGAFTFTNLVPCVYQLKIATPPALYPLSSVTTNSSDDQTDNDDNGTQTMPTAPVVSPMIDIAHGESDLTVDFGFTGMIGAYSISGQVRDDYDLDGSFSDNDAPVPNVTVQLYGDSNGNGSFDLGIDLLIDTTTTDPLGNYTFDNVPDGTYFVREVDPNPSNSTADTEGPNDNLIKVVIAGASSLNNDFLDAVDPSGYIYLAPTGQIIAGGAISVIGPGNITILMDGSTGQYSFVTDTAGTYTLTYSPPLGYMIDPLRPVAGPSFDPTGGPDPTTLGSAENPGNPGFLTNFTSGANPYYLVFDLAPGDPFVVNNNIPLVEIKPTTFTGWQYANPLGGQNGATQNPDGDRFDNLQEYAFCYAPNTGVSIGCPLRIVGNANGTVDAQVRRAVGLSDIIYTLEYIADLASSGAGGAGWTDVTTILPVVVNNGNGTETATYPDLATLPGLIAGKGFVRIRVDLDANNDTVPEETTRTLASGWETRALTVQCQTCSMPFFPCDIFSGAVDSVAGSTLNVATSVGTGSVAGAFTSGREYYLEVLSGDNAGHRLDIDEAASTATSLVISTVAGHHNTLTSVPANLAGDVIAVRQHHTLDDVFVKSKFTATNSQVTADRLLFFSPVAGTFNETYWLFFNAGAPKWVLSSDAGLADRGSVILDPAEAVYAHCRTAAVDLVLSGHVRQNSFACPLSAGHNLIGSGFPMAQSPAIRQMTVGNGFTGGRDPRLVDQIRFWAGDSTTGTEAYISHFLLDYSTLHHWAPQSNASLLNENNLMLFESLHGAFIKSISGNPNWVLPSPWTP